MEAYYTKSNPKVVDYNPLTHLAFYSQPAPKSRPSQGPSSSNPSPFMNPAQLRPTSIVAKSLFSNKRNLSSLIISNNDSQRHYKTRVRSKVVDTISGEIKEFSIQRPRVETLDVNSYRDKMTNDVDYDSLKNFTENKKQFKSTDNIAGALRKEVPLLPYVNIFALRSKLNSNLN